MEVIVEDTIRGLSDELNITNLLEAQGITRCPNGSSMSLEFPSTTIIFVVLSTCTFMVAAIVAWRYNHVIWTGGERVDVLRPLSVSNAPWVTYFVVCGLRGLVGCLLMGVNSWHNNERVVDALDYTMMTFHAISDLALTVALFHQYYHRSEGASFSHTDDAMHSDDTSSEGAVSSQCSKLRQVLTSPECATAFLALITITAAWFGVKESEAPYSNPYWVYVSALGVQRFPIYMLLFLICFPTKRGATRLSRAALFMGFLLALPYDMPWRVWVQNILTESMLTYNDGCVLKVMSILDCMLLLHAIAVLHFLYFIVSEFKRTHELEYYDCIQHYTACS